MYKVNAWINSHPGGEQLMLHFIGRDVSGPEFAWTPSCLASQPNRPSHVFRPSLPSFLQATDNINVSHLRATVEKKMKAFHVGELAESERGVSSPPIA